ncbi:RNA 3'-terminal phosphate cyclase [Xenophilus arseniciresistens]|uniref:RNA 3'-terminal phosphate cyclase n=1 Tax=Xenophilus arseniciresistens TaxID=1283306 RepID=A0AAE3N8U4_9BURK|nr:RNA 3'-terminal phosphate cyclase [Xenophilus arseniciresistens]MDA7415409.1 RNA 3'-terminal phosphate cyclase [Xenophilus arseniciresistens]
MKDEEEIRQTIELDGSQGEGGGQILRTGLALAMITQRPLALSQIRARRPKPGLMRQHLACVQAAAAISGAQVQGAELGAQALRFTPGPVRAGDYRFAIASAGSCTLLLQTVLPALWLAAGPSTVHLQGGTHNPMAPSFHFLAQAYAPLLRRLGGDLQLQLRRHGFYPAGGGEIQAQITPLAAVPQPFDLLERGPQLSASAECLVPGLARQVGARELQVLREALGWSHQQLRVGAARQDEGPGNALMATLVHLHSTELITVFGERGRTAEAVAQALVDEVRAWEASEAALGEHLADQWVLLLALACWRSGQPAAFSCTRVSAHLRTNCAVIERFLPLRIGIDEAAVAGGGGAVVRVQPL